MAISSPKWISQIIESYKFTKPLDPSISWALPLTFIASFAGIFGLGTILNGAFGIILKFTAIIWAIMFTLLVFGKKAEKAAYGSVEGVPGAAAQVLTTLKGGWFTTPAVEINKNQEIVHRLVGRPGVILVIEAKPGSPIAQVAKQKAARWVGETPITEIWVGRGEGQAKGDASSTPLRAKNHNNGETNGIPNGNALVLSFAYSVYRNKSVTGDLG